MNTHKYVKTEYVKEYHDSGQIPGFSGLHEVVVDCILFLQEILPSRTEFKQQYIKPVAAVLMSVRKVRKIRKIKKKNMENKGGIIRYIYITQYCYPYKSNK